MTDRDPVTTRGIKSLATDGALGAVSSRRLSRWVGRLADAKLPRNVVRQAIRWYVQAYGVDVSEMADPMDSFDTFDAFFTRKLKDGVHTIDDTPNALVSPADARVLNAGRVCDGQLDQIKGRTYRLNELLDSNMEAARFTHGSYITLYLSPKDYHRVHSPIAGRITHYRYVPGRLYPVNNLGVNNVDRLFAVNERLITYIESDLGAVAVVMVGASNVGKITVCYDDIVTNESNKNTAYTKEFQRKISIDRGEELGMFHLGSTVVLITDNADLQMESLQRDDPVRVGNRLFQA